MNRLIFYFVIFLSVVFVALTLVDTWMDQTYEIALNQQKAIQAHLTNAQRIHAGAQQLLRRMAVDSQHDPALWEVLKKNKIKVIFPPGAITPEGMVAPATNAVPAISTP